MSMPDLQVQLLRASATEAQRRGARNAPLATTWPLVERRAVRRRPNMDQGRALEMLGHAIEYLIDSSEVSGDGAGMPSNYEAVRLLKCASRSVFADCPEVVPFGQRLSDWLGRIGGPAASRDKGKL